MWNRRHWSIVGTLLGGLVLGGCTDYLTGQLGEPPGALLVTKLTLLDSSSRDQWVFTDTSIPDCALAPDCTLAVNQDLPICRVCYSEVAKDKYSHAHSVPTPDSGTDLRVVFNKIPKMFGGQALTNDSDFSAIINLSCSPPCAGSPPITRALNIIGSNLSFEPTFIPYGPSLQILVDRSADARVSLEPDTTYQVRLANQLAGRDGVTVQLDDAALRLLTFKTEPFKVLSVGKGDSADVTQNDSFVYSDTSMGSGSTSDPYQIDALPETGVVALRMNASVDAAVAKSAIVSATVDGNPVDVSLGVNEFTFDADGNCVHDDQRTLYVVPTTLAQWPTGKILSITIPAGAIRDLNQASGAAFLTGRHVISTPLSVTVVLLGGPAGSDYGGQTISGARGTSHC